MRTWARGDTTAYKYNGFGQVTNVVYSDFMTPEVNYEYDRIGRITRAASGDYVVEYEYTGLELNKEIHNGVEFDRSYDTLGRSSGYALKPAGASQSSGGALLDCNVKCDKLHYA